jgi:hypothetical protein
MLCCCPCTWLHLPHETCMDCNMEKTAINTHYSVQAVLKRTYMCKLPAGWAPLAVQTVGMQRQGLQLAHCVFPLTLNTSRSKTRMSLATRKEPTANSSNDLQVHWALGGRPCCCP